ncbi:MAG: sensor histidine kinase, partial [Bacteroidota bacterium]
GISVLARFLNIYIGEALLYPDAPNENLLEIIMRPRETMDIYLGRFLPFTFWFVFVKIGIDQLRSQQQVAQLKQEKTAAELSFLKAQIHPHFLFNTLNNLYTLTLEKSDEAPEVVVKLSEMLDYLLYHAKATKVPIGREIELIENYLGLEELRYGDRLQLTFHYDIDDPTAMISPLLLLSPVENAFKHGASGITERTLIRITLTVKAGQLHFQVWNTKPPTPPVDERAYTKGIGLKNVSSQLDLTYPNRHVMDITDTSDDYTVDLRIEL